jgi:hypothetical protein
MCKALGSVLNTARERERERERERDYCRCFKSFKKLHINKQFSYYGRLVCKKKKSSGSNLKCSLHREDKRSASL